MTIDEMVVELHGTMFTELSDKVNRGIADVQHAIFMRGEMRSWLNNGIPVFLPSADNDIILVFTHILNHFYVGGVGLRQICDWCRLLWTHRGKIDCSKLERRLDAMGVIDEWRVFGTFAVEYLGMPVEAMPLLVEKMNARLQRKSDRLCRVILRSGNMGHNLDHSYRSRYSFFWAKCISFSRQLGEYVRLSAIFPVNSFVLFVNYFLKRLKATVVSR